MKNKIVLEELKPGIYKISGIPKNTDPLDFSEIGKRISNPIKEKKKKFIYLNVVVNSKGEYVDSRDCNVYTKDIRHAMFWHIAEDCEVTEPDEKIKKLKFVLEEE